MHTLFEFWEWRSFWSSESFDWERDISWKFRVLPEIAWILTQDNVSAIMFASPLAYRISVENWRIKSQSAGWVSSDKMISRTVMAVSEGRFGTQ